MFFFCFPCNPPPHQTHVTVNRYDHNSSVVAPGEHSPSLIPARVLRDERRRHPRHLVPCQVSATITRRRRNWSKHLQSHHLRTALISRIKKILISKYSYQNSVTLTKGQNRVIFTSLQNFCQLPLNFFKQIIYN